MGKSPSVHLLNTEYLVFPFGFPSASVVFQALVNVVLQDFLSRSVFLYLDDSLIVKIFLTPSVSAAFANPFVLQDLLSQQLQLPTCHSPAPARHALLFLSPPSSWIFSTFGFSLNKPSFYYCLCRACGSPPSIHNNPSGTTKLHSKCHQTGN